MFGVMNCRRARGRHVGRGQAGNTGTEEEAFEAGPGLGLLEDACEPLDNDDKKVDAKEEDEAEEEVDGELACSVRTCFAQTVCPQCRVVGATRRAGGEHAGQARRGEYEATRSCMETECS